MTHGIGDFDKAGNIGAVNVVDEVAFLTIVHTIFVDVTHDGVQLCVNLFTRPVQTLGVLAHFQTRDGVTARIAGFTWCIQCVNFKG